MIRIKHLFLLVFVLLLNTLLAQKSIWNLTDESRIPNVKSLTRQIVPQKYSLYQLDFEALKKTLLQAPLRFSENVSNNNSIVEIPFPDGSFHRFSVEEAPVMHSDLQAKYPSVRSFAAYGIDNRHENMRCEFSPEGFSAMIFSNEKTIFIDPFAKNNSDFYIVYDKKDFFSDKKMECLLNETSDIQPLTNDGARLGDGKLRIYRLALACTGEYATFHGGTLPKVIAAVNKTMTRVNGIYEKEHSITLVLVPNNEKLLYLDANTDPYTNNTPNTLIGQSQNNATAVIGSANFDMAHTFSTGAGGLAGLGVICNNASKGRGITGINTPVGDPYDVDFVSHEMGHQFGGEHTFNNTCGGNISANSAYETGSGSTIMAYAGVCSPNVQLNSDAYFHLQSLLQIYTYSNTGTGNNCPQKVNINNNTDPTVSAGLDYKIPKSTPFELIASGSDADGDPMTFCWEQWDKQSAPGAPKATNTVGPAFRSYFPKSSTTRVFPNLDNLTKNTNNTWEVLSSVTRKYTFRCTVRDNHNGFGRTANDEMLIDVDATTGPFLVTEPNTAVNWETSTKKMVTWNVAGTDLAPINCANVNILLSTDGGYTYPDTLAKDIPNNGSYEIKVPNKLSTKARIKVKGAGNIFFDISNVNFNIILPPVPTFTVATTGQNLVKICKEKTDSTTLDLNVNALNGFKENVKLSLKNAPANLKYSFSQDTITPSGTIKILFYDLKKLKNGIYKTLIITEGTTKKDTFYYTISAFEGTPSISKGIFPNNYKGFQVKNQSLKWQSTVNTSSYVVQISKDYLFAIIDETAEVVDTTYLPTSLKFGTVYFWRVKAKNHCTEALPSTVFSFQTIDKICSSFDGTNVPFIIPINSTLDQKLDAVAVGNSIVSDVEVSINLNHTFLSDLILNIESPNGKSAELINTQCTSNDNIDATFSDAGVPLVCANLPAIKGIVKPNTPLSIFKGNTSNGIWKLRVRDTYATDFGGVVNSWNLKVCSEDAVQVPINLIKNQFKIVENTNKAVNNQFLNATSPNVLPIDITYLITKLPTQGTLRKGSTVLTLGAKISQQEINSGALLYYNIAPSSPLDSFQFMISTNNKAWRPTETFLINVLTGNLLTASATQTKPVACNNEKNAEIGMDVIGGLKPYQYSIDGGLTYKDTSYFSNLAAGKYFPIIKDAQGLVKKLDSIVIKNPDLLKITAIKDSNNIYLKISGGTKPYLINFNNKGFSTVDSFYQLSNGKYAIAVKDANNCSTKDTVGIFINTLVVNGLVNKTIKCYNDKNGEIVVNVKSGKAPLEYQINGGTYQASNKFSGLSSGKYLVIVKDADGLTKKTDSLKLENPLELIGKVDVFKDSVYAEIQGGTGFLLYSIDNGTFNSKNTFANLNNGTHTIVAKDENGCTKSYSVKTSIVTVSLDNFKSVTCAGKKDGELQFLGDGGKKPYLFSIDNGVTFQSSNIFSNLSGGTYNIAIKDSLGDVKKISLKLAEPTAIKISATITTNSVLLTATGGTTPYTYSQQGGPQGQTSKIFQNLTGGDYIFEVKDANGCTETIAVKGVKTFDLEEKLGVLIAPNPTDEFINIKFSKTNDKATDLQISNLQGQIVYKTILAPAISQQKIDVSNLPNGTYQLLLRQDEHLFVSRIVVLK